MSVLNFWERMIDIVRNSHYTITFKRNEELPLEIWAYLVKRRADFKCEECGINEKERRLDSHHIKRPEDGGKNTLRNGKALCSKCHGKAHTIKVPKRKLSQVLVKALGKRFLGKLRRCKSREEVEELVNEHTHQ